MRFHLTVAWYGYNPFAQVVSVCRGKPLVYPVVYRPLDILLVEAALYEVAPPFVVEAENC